MAGGPRCWLSHKLAKVSNLVHGWRRIRTVERVNCFYEEKNDYNKRFVRTPILGHTDLACNTSYHFSASRTVLPRVPPYLARDRLRLLAHVYDSVASIHMTKNPGRHD